MWNTDSLWFETSIVSITIALGHILLGHFEERTPRARKFFKFLVTLIIVIGLSIFFGRTIALSVYGILFLFVLYVHIILLPKKGINGWTGEPKSKYYEYRKWEKDIFKEK